LQDGRQRDPVEQKEKVMLFYAEMKSVIITQRGFRVHFSTRWAPAKQTICRLKMEFEEEGSVLEQKGLVKAE
jgi:hypothetical protein